MRLLVARCTVTYQGRLGARLPDARRLILIKADGSVAVHSDAKAYKPLNWMSPPCVMDETDDVITVTNGAGERLHIEIGEVLEDRTVELGEDPGLAKDGVEADLQQLLAERPDAVEAGLTLIRREYPTDIGPVDLLCRAAAGATVAVEVKRVGEIAGVEQLLRYLERLGRDPLLAPVRGVFVATRMKPQAETFAASRGVATVTVGMDELRGLEPASLRLF